MSKEYESIDYWKNRAQDYEYLYEEQKSITIGYKELLNEYISKIERFNRKITSLENKIHEQNIILDIGNQ